jgi:hypothetical protein
LRGSCPNLTFELRGASVYTDGSTHFRKGDCKHMEPGRRVTVKGKRQADGRVKAERIELDRHD